MPLEPESDLPYCEAEGSAIGTPQQCLPETGVVIDPALLVALALVALGGLVLWWSPR